MNTIRVTTRTGYGYVCGLTKLCVPPKLGDRVEAKTTDGDRIELTITKIIHREDSNGNPYLELLLH